jgi:hypothetical protein
MEMVFVHLSELAGQYSKFKEFKLSAIFIQPNHEVLEIMISAKSMNKPSSLVEVINLINQKLSD